MPECEISKYTQKIIDENLFESNKGYKSFNQLMKKCKCEWCMSVKEYENNLKKQKDHKNVVS